MDQETLEATIVRSAIARYLAELQLEKLIGPGGSRSRHRKTQYNAIANADRTMMRCARELAKLYQSTPRT